MDPQIAVDPNQWQQTLPELRKQYPKATDGILFCVHKLSRDPSLTLPDFRDEAAALGIKLGGRALHSAKVLLGMAEASTRRKKSPLDVETPPRASRNGSTRKSSSRTPTSPAPRSAAELETSIIQTIQQIQDQATAESQRLREAMRKAIAVLSEALED